MFEKYRPAITLVVILGACFLIILLVGSLASKLDDACAKEQVSIAEAISRTAKPCEKN